MTVGVVSSILRALTLESESPLLSVITGLWYDVELTIESGLSDGDILETWIGDEDCDSIFRQASSKLSSTITSGKITYSKGLFIGTKGTYKLCLKNESDVWYTDIISAIGISKPSCDTMKCNSAIFCSEDKFCTTIITPVKSTTSEGRYLLTKNECPPPIITSTYPAIFTNEGLKIELNTDAYINSSTDNSSNYNLCFSPVPDITTPDLFVTNLSIVYIGKLDVCTTESCAKAVPLSEPVFFRYKIPRYTDIIPSRMLITNKFNIPAPLVWDGSQYITEYYTIQESIVLPTNLLNYINPNFQQWKAPQDAIGLRQLSKTHYNEQLSQNTISKNKLSNIIYNKRDYHYINKNRYLNTSNYISPHILIINNKLKPFPTAYPFSTFQLSEYLDIKEVRIIFYYRHNLMNNPPHENSKKYEFKILGTSNEITLWWTYIETGIWEFQYNFQIDTMFEESDDKISYSYEDILHANLMNFKKYISKLSYIYFLILARPKSVLNSSILLTGIQDALQNKNDIYFQGKYNVSMNYLLGFSTYCSTSLEWFPNNNISPRKIDKKDIFDRIKLEALCLLPSDFSVLKNIPENFVNENTNLLHSIYISSLPQNSYQELGLIIWCNDLDEIPNLSEPSSLSLIENVLENRRLNINDKRNKKSCQINKKESNIYSNIKYNLRDSVDFKVYDNFLPKLLKYSELYSSKIKRINYKVKKKVDYINRKLEDSAINNTELLNSLPKPETFGIAPPSIPWGILLNKPQKIKCNICQNIENQNPHDIYTDCSKCAEISYQDTDIHNRSRSRYIGLHSVSGPTSNNKFQFFTGRSVDIVITGRGFNPFNRVLLGKYCVLPDKSVMTGCSDVCKPQVDEGTSVSLLSSITMNNNKFPMALTPAIITMAKMNSVIRRSSHINYIPENEYFEWELTLYVNSSDLPIEIDDIIDIAEFTSNNIDLYFLWEYTRKIHEGYKVLEVIKDETQTIFKLDLGPASKLYDTISVTVSDEKYNLPLTSLSIKKRKASFPVNHSITSSSAININEVIRENISDLINHTSEIDFDQNIGLENLLELSFSDFNMMWTTPLNYASNPVIEKLAQSDIISDDILNWDLSVKQEVSDITIGLKGNFWIRTNKLTILSEFKSIEETSGVICWASDEKSNFIKAGNYSFNTPMMKYAALSVSNHMHTGEGLTYLTINIGDSLKESSNYINNIRIAFLHPPELRTLIYNKKPFDISIEIHKIIEEYSCSEKCPRILTLSVATRSNEIIINLFISPIPSSELPSRMSFTLYTVMSESYSNDCNSGVALMRIEFLQPNSDILLSFIAYLKEKLITNVSHINAELSLLRQDNISGMTSDPDLNRINSQTEETRRVSIKHIKLL